MMDFLIKSVHPSDPTARRIQQHVDVRQVRASFCCRTFAQSQKELIDLIACFKHSLNFHPFWNHDPN